MNAETFEENVRNLRRQQKLYFRTPKDDPTKMMILMGMRDKEKELAMVINRVKSLVMKDATVSDRKKFFFAVDDMMEAQREWIKNGFIDLREKAQKEERNVDEWLRTFKYQREKKEHEDAQKNQLNLFDI